MSSNKSVNGREEDGATRLEARQRVSQYFETLVRVSAARDQAALPVLHVGQRAKAVVLEFEQPILIIEGFERTG